MAAASLAVNRSREHLPISAQVPKSNTNTDLGLGVAGKLVAETHKPAAQAAGLPAACRAPVMEQLPGRKDERLQGTRKARESMTHCCLLPPDMCCRDAT